MDQWKYHLFCYFDLWDLCFFLGLFEVEELVVHQVLLIVALFEFQGQDWIAVHALVVEGVQGVFQNVKVHSA